MDGFLWLLGGIMARHKNPSGRSESKGRKSPHKAPHKAPHRPLPAARAPHVPTNSGRPLLYGKHAVIAALANPQRKIHCLMLTPDNRDSLQNELQAAIKSGGHGAIEIIAMAKRDIEERLPPDAVHQGIALEVEPLRGWHIEDILEKTEGQPRATILFLDQATDPHNIGAILRSAAAFGAAAVVVPDRNAPDITSVMAKAASGALERVALVRVTNLVRAMDKAKEAGFWCIGLDGQATAPLAEADMSGRVALILGAEGGGLRRLTRENCDFLVKVPMSGAVESLNLSNAAAIALYERARQ